MARATGIGGAFFKARDPEALQAWYVEHLGLPVSSDGAVVFHWSADPSGSSVWAAFPESTDYFGDNHSMINFRVDDLDGLRDHLRDIGMEVDDSTQEYPFGRFGWAHDPEGNRFEMWEPTAIEQP